MKQKTPQFVLEGSSRMQEFQVGRQQRKPCHQSSD